MQCTRSGGSLYGPNFGAVAVTGMNTGATGVVVGSLPSMGVDTGSAVVVVGSLPSNGVDTGPAGVVVGSLPSQLLTHDTTTPSMVAEIICPICLGSIWR